MTLKNLWKLLGHRQQSKVRWSGSESLMCGSAGAYADPHTPPRRSSAKWPYPELVDTKLSIIVEGEDHGGTKSGPQIEDDLGDQARRALL